MSVNLTNALTFSPGGHKSAGTVCDRRKDGVMEELADLLKSIFSDMAPGHMNRAVVPLVLRKFKAPVGQGLQRFGSVCFWGMAALH